MTLHTDTLMPAKNPTDHTPTTGPAGEGVKAVALFEPRRARVTRAWDELSEIDRAVLLESVRQRRKAQRRKASIESSIYHLRSNR